MKFVDQRLQRLDELQRQRPQFAELLGFYQALYRFFRDQPGPLLTLAPAPAERSAQGFPRLTAASLHFEPQRLDAFLGSLLEILRQFGQEGQADLEHLQQALANGRFDALPLLQAAFERRREPLVRVAQELKVAPAILAYLLDVTLSFALHEAVEAEQLQGDVDWHEGVCPVCGGLPSVAELAGEEGARRLHCGSCGTSWVFPRQTCPFCGNQEKREKEYFTAGDERGYRVDLCRACNCYLKTVDGRELGAGLPMDIEDVVTLYLDILAQKEGFSQGKQPLA